MSLNAIDTVLYPAIAALTKPCVIELKTGPRVLGFPVMRLRFMDTGESAVDLHSGGEPLGSLDWINCSKEEKQALEAAVADKDNRYTYTTASERAACFPSRIP